MLCLDLTAFSLDSQISINHVNEPGDSGKNKRSLRQCLANVVAGYKELWLLSSSALTRKQ